MSNGIKAALRKSRAIAPVCHVLEGETFESAEQAALPLVELIHAFFIQVCEMT
jgi:hypothetical protein